MSRFLVEAMIQMTEGVPYTKVAFISGNEDVNYHKQGLQAIYYKVLSVKTVPADQALLLEYGDTQGNTLNPDGVPLDPTGEIVIDDDSTDRDTA